jgi:hypothetical protein
MTDSHSRSLPIVFQSLGKFTVAHVSMTRLSSGAVSSLLRSKYFFSALRRPPTTSEYLLN